MSALNNLESAARKARREKMKHYPPNTTTSSVELRVILPEMRFRKKGLAIPFPSEVFPTEYNQRLPEWRLRANHSANKEQWKNWKEYQLAALGTAMGLNNIIYFPFHALYNGRGSYICAFVVIEFVVGYPILFLQMALGQFTSKSALRVFSLVPLAHGTGIALALLSLINLVQSTVKHSRILFFVFSAFNIRFYPSFSWQLPWLDCTWSDDEIYHVYHCQHYDHDVFNNTPSVYCAGKYYHNVVMNYHGRECEHPDPSSLHWPLIGCLFLVCAFAYALVYRGIKMLGKVMIYAVPSAIVLLVVFVFVELASASKETFQAAIGGINIFFTPDWDEFLNIQLWFNVMCHVVESLNLDQGTMIMIGSYARFQSPTHYHAFYVCLAYVCLSLFAGILLSIHMGIYGFDMKKPIHNISWTRVMDSRYFVTILRAIEGMDAFPPVWVFMFFSTLLFLGLMYMVATSLIIIKPLNEYFPKMQKWSYLVNMLLFVILFFLSVPFVTTGSRTISALMTLLLPTPTKYIGLVCSAMSVAAFVYGYGLKRLRQDIDFMLQFYPNKFFCFIWVLVPVIMLVLICAELADKESYTEPKYEGHASLLWLTFFGVLLPIPLAATWNVVRYHMRGELRKVFYPQTGLAVSGRVLPEALPLDGALNQRDQQQLIRIDAHSILPMAYSLRRASVPTGRDDTDSLHVMSSLSSSASSVGSRESKSMTASSTIKKINKNTSSTSSAIYNK